jgi:hypothetical protein
MDAAGVFLAALLTALATGLGALPLLVRRRVDATGVGLATAVAAGFMLGASVGLFSTGAADGIVRTSAGAVLGAGFIVVTRWRLGLRHGVHSARFGAPTRWAR